MSAHPEEQPRQRHSSHPPESTVPSIPTTNNRHPTATHQRKNVPHTPVVAPTSPRYKQQPQQPQSPRRAHFAPEPEVEIGMKMDSSPVHQTRDHRTSTANIQRPRPAHVVVHSPTSPRHVHAAAQSQGHDQHSDVPSHSERHSTEITTTNQAPLPPPKSPRSPNSPAIYNQSLSKRLLSVLAHKPTLSKTWEKRSYAEEARSLSLSPTSTERSGSEGNETRISRSRPTSFYASPADIAAYRPLPMVEGGPVYPYSAPVTPVPAPTPPSHA